MIRHRMVHLDSAAERAIEWLRSAKPMEEVAPAVLAVLAEAAGSVWAAHWVIDTVGQRLRPFATWSTSEDEALPFGQDAQLLLSLGFGSAAVVWCGRKPVWSTTGFSASLPPPGASTAPGWHGGVWFAVKTDTAVYGVIELLGRALESKAPENLGCLERLGFRLGLALEEALHRESRAQSLTSQRRPSA